MLQNFIHLRVYTSYSLSEGAVRIEELPYLCHKYKMPAVSVTDRNNLFGSLEFSQKVSNEGIQPIMGLLVSFKLKDIEYSSVQSSIILLVKDEIGYFNILEITNRLYNKNTDNEEHYLTIDDLKDLNKGLILLTGGAEGPIGSLVLKKEREKAESLLVEFQKIFNDRLYIEIYRHGLEPENITEPYFLDFAFNHNIPIVATNKVYFSDMSMYQAHDALLCIASGNYVDQDDRVKSNKEFYFKSPREMSLLFSDLPEAIENTIVISKRCAFMPPSRDPILPRYECNKTNEEELSFLSKQGLEKRLETKVLPKIKNEDEKNKIKEIYNNRLDYELEIIIKMKFSGYFLIVSDFIRWGKRNNIPIGPGRGSGAGSIVAWSLEITDLDPISFNLLFERFLNPERISMPDFDIDFCQERRDEIISYVQKRYGANKVAQIITFGKLQARAVVRDIGRVLNLPYSRVDQISKMIPFNPIKQVTLQEAINSDSSLKNMQKTDADISRLLDISLKLEGLYRHASTHAAGIVIADREIYKLVPVYKDNKSDMYISGYSMKYTEASGLVKFDFLGLKTLTVISNSCELIKNRVGEINISDIALDDKKSFELLVSGDTIGVFQLESPGMRDAMRKLKPDCIEDIIALISLYRPGPMDKIPSYIARKHGKEEIDYIDPMIEEVLKETYGVIIYQEQVMKIAQVMGGYTLSAADLLRRAMGKKDIEEMNIQRKKFISGAMKKKISSEKATYVFDLVAKFAGYGFNKSHAAAYALISYQTAYLKAYYPVEFYVASMNLEIHHTDKIFTLYQDIKIHNIEVLLPCINNSEAFFTREVTKEDGQLAIRWALGAIKNSSIAAMESLVEERKKNGQFKDMMDFISRVDNKVLNKRQIEALAKAGVFDVFNKNRNYIFSNTEKYLSYGHRSILDKESSQNSLFSGVFEKDNIKLKEVSCWNEVDQVKYEFESFGLYINQHPMDIYKPILDKKNILWAFDIENNISDGISDIKIAGVIISSKVKPSPRGRFMYLVISDPTGLLEISIFEDKLIEDSIDLLKEGTMLYIDANAKKDTGGIRLTATSIKDLFYYLGSYKENLYIDIKSTDIPNLKELKKIVSNSNVGNINIILNIALEKNIVVIKLDKAYNADSYMLNSICDLFGSNIFFN